MGSYNQNSLPFPILHTIVADMRYFRSLKQVNGVISQCEPDNWGTYGLNYYVFSKMAWNPHLELGNIVDDYCAEYYGPASEPMRRYFGRLEAAMAATEHFGFVEPPQLILNLLNRQTFSDLRDDLKSARDLADDAMIFDRIRKHELSLEHAWLLWQALDYFRKGVSLQKKHKNREAQISFQKTVETGEKLVSFLFKNAEEGVFIIPRSYIFDYLEPTIAEARDRAQTLGGS